MKGGRSRAGKGAGGGVGEMRQGGERYGSRRCGEKRVLVEVCENRGGRGGIVCVV